MDDAEAAKVFEAAEAEAAKMAAEEVSLSEMGPAARMAEQFSCAVFNMRKALTPGKLGENHPLSARAQRSVNRAIDECAKSIAFLASLIGPAEDD